MRWGETVPSRVFHCALLGPVPLPFAAVTSKSLPTTASAAGYHSVGMKPSARMGCDQGVGGAATSTGVVRRDLGDTRGAAGGVATFATLNTATASAEASATKRRWLSSLKAS